jgi:hypothetical protein
MNNFFKKIGNANFKFGLLITIALVLFTTYFYIENFSGFIWIPFAIGSVGIAVITFKLPKSLDSYRKVWIRFGEILGKFINPFILGVIFFCLLTPFGVIGRICGRDPLRLKVKDAESYWLDKNSFFITPESFKNQY